jgi:hypothetical protein
LQYSLLRHCHVLGSLGYARHRISPIASALGPLERRPIAGSFLKGGAIGLNCLLKPFRPTLKVPQSLKRNPEIICSSCPIERPAPPSSFLKGSAVGNDRLPNPRHPSLNIAELGKKVSQCGEREAEVVLCGGPAEWNALAGSFFERSAKSGHCLLKPFGAAFALP